MARAHSAVAARSHLYSRARLAACQRNQADAHKGFRLVRVLLEHALIAMRYLSQPARQRSSAHYAPRVWMVMRSRNRSLHGR